MVFFSCAPRCYPKQFQIYVFSILIQNSSENLLSKIVYHWSVEAIDRREERVRLAEDTYALHFLFAYCVSITLDNTHLFFLGNRYVNNGSSKVIAAWLQYVHYILRMLDAAQRPFVT